MFDVYGINSSLMNKRTHIFTIVLKTKQKYQYVTSTDTVLTTQSDIQ